MPSTQLVRQSRHSARSHFISFHADASREITRRKSRPCHALPAGQVSAFPADFRDPSFFDPHPHALRLPPTFRPLTSNPKRAGAPFQPIECNNFARPKGAPHLRTFNPRKCAVRTFKFDVSPASRLRVSRYLSSFKLSKTRRTMSHPAPYRSPTGIQPSELGQRRRPHSHIALARSASEGHALLKISADMAS